MSAPLIEIRKNSAEWRSLADWAEHYLSVYRLQLESESVSADKVAGLRGRISVLKSLLKSTVEDHDNDAARPAG